MPDAIHRIRQTEGVENGPKESGQANQYVLRRQKPGKMQALQDKELQPERRQDMEEEKKKIKVSKTQEETSTFP